ncbi:MAG: acyl-CoA thioesterase [Pseudomonadota bacterium]
MSELAKRTRFDHWVTHTIRYNDQDPVGHVNNAAMATFLEQGRTDFIYPIMRAHAPASLEIVLARVEIDYLRELNFPGDVDIGSAISRVGTKSLKLVHGVFEGGSDICVATGVCTLVFFDTGTRMSVEPPTAIRSELEQRVRA